MKVLLPTSVELAPEAVDGVAYVPYDPQVPIPTHHHDAEALVVWGNPDALLRDAARRLTRVRWVQTLAAGYEALRGAGFADTVTLTSGQSLHDDTVAEHALALCLAAVRSLPDAMRAQRLHRWATEIGGRQSERLDEPLRTLHGARVTVWGFGGIATRLATLLDALGARVTGVARHAGTRAGYRVHAVADLPALLPDTDILVTILPGTPGNRGALDGPLLGLLPPRAWLVNVGRGETVDEDALVAALRREAIAGAALDVFATEPLPAASPLWDLPNVIITPHAAGGRPRGADALITQNLRALRSGASLRNVVPREESTVEGEDSA
ncbi:phosphoglycerate dehydrogenase [Rugosimonospora acidiphila]|uniref:Phosphoglycerate dehydrogenase n=1 Tax=Rugosimonospora acidiphila TaxID=556531 RepID=A0ABP9SP47_9ACTN